MMPRDPLAVEVLAGDDDDAAAAEVEGRGQDAAVPERHDRLAAARRDRVEVLEPLRTPAQRRAEQRHHAVSERRDQRRFSTLRSRRTPATSALATGHGAGRSHSSARYIPLYCGPPPPSGGTQVMTWYGIHDVARLAVHAVGRVDLQPLAAGAVRDDHLVHVRGTEAHARVAVLRGRRSSCRRRCARAGATG